MWMQVNRNPNFVISTQYNKYDGYEHFILRFTGINKNYTKDEFIKEAINCIIKSWEFIEMYQRLGNIPFKKIRKEEHEKRKVAKKLRWSIYKKDDFTCQKCGIQEDLEVDHIIPLSKGGKDELINLQTLCKPCNVRKKDKIQDENHARR